jgi:hypothetical protein
MSCANWIQVAGTASLAEHAERAELFAGEVGLLSLRYSACWEHQIPNIQSLEDPTPGCG